MTEYIEFLMAGDRHAIAQLAAGYFVIMGVYGLIHMRRVSRWPSVIGQLHEEGIDRMGASLREDTMYRATVRYTYTVDGAPFENNRINTWHVGLSHNLRMLLKWQFRYIDRQGSSGVTVFYNPHKPEKAYLVVPGWKQMTTVAVLCFGAAALILFGA